MENILLIISSVLVFIGYVGFFILLNDKSKSNNSSNEVVVDLINNYSNINMIKDNDTIFSKYDSKRKVVRLSKKDYDNDTYISNSIAILLSYYHITENKYLKYFSYIFRNIKCITFIPLIVLFLSLIINTEVDSIIILIVFIFLGLYQALINNINNEVLYKDIIKDYNISNCIRKINSLNSILFLSIFLLIIRVIVLIIS